MNEVVVILTQIIETPGMLFRIGMMIATAMIIGFVVIESYNIFIKVILVGSILILFEEWMHFAIIASMSSSPSTHPNTMSIYTTIIAVVIFAIGLAAGSVIGIDARKKERCMIKARNEVINEINDGSIQKKSI